MKATTVKIEGELLEELEAAKPRGQSISAYVREVLRKNLERAEVREAAFRYMEFVNSNEDEHTWLDEWDCADLSTAPEAGKTR